MSMLKDTRPNETRPPCADQPGNQTTRKIVMCVAAALSYALPLEHFCHVLADAGLHVAKRRGIARLAQLGRIGLGVALVTPLQVFREGNVADQDRKSVV